MIDKLDLKNFDQIFEYPGWIEFSDAANQTIFDWILQGKLTDEQIDYFFGAADMIRNYDQWFEDQLFEIFWSRVGNIW